MNRSILVIEHHPTTRALLELLLREQGSVVTADSGEGALLQLGMSDFDCIVLGSPIPVEFGGESSTLLELLDRIAPALASRVIVITSTAAKAVIRRALASNVFALFTDTFDAGDLVRAVQRCIRGEAPLRRFKGAMAAARRLR